MMALSDKSNFERRPHRTVHDEFELIDKDGFSHGSFKTVKDLGEYVEKNFSGQEQDEDRTGKGWDCQVVGCDRG